MKTELCSWLHSPLDAGVLRRLASAMRAKSYDPTANEGYVLDTSRSDILVGTFIRRKEWTDRLRPRPGSPAEEYKRVALQAVNFRLSITFPEIELSLSREAAKVLLARLAVLSPEIERPTPVRVDPMAWLVALERSTQLKVISLTSSVIPLQSNVSMKAVFEGTSDVRALLSRRYPKLLTSPRKIAIEFQGANQGGIRVEIAATGTARTNSGDETSRARLRAALAESFRQTAYPPLTPQKQD